MKNSTKRSLWRRLAGAGVLIALLAAASYILFNRQQVVDQLTVWQYRPSGDIAALAENSGMSERGRFLFYAASPALQEKEAFSASCTNKEPNSFVLGCYASGLIYIFNVQEDRLDGVREVTAAHEMLHVAYDRLSDDERERVDGLLDALYRENLTDDELGERLKLYDKAEPGQRLNELFAIFGTEFETVGSELEAVYSKYFSDRARVVRLSQAYKAVFRALETQAQVIEARVTALVDERNQLVEAYNQSFRDLQAEITAYQARSSGMGASQSREEALRLNAAVDELNARYESVQQTVAGIDQQIEALKTEYQGVSTTQRELQANLDSRLTPAAPPAE